MVIPVRLLALAPAALLLAALPAQAATQPLLAAVEAGDADLGLGLAAFQPFVDFNDVNGNGVADLGDPDETVYLDLDGDHTVSYGDVRLTAFLAYPALSVADTTNRDIGRVLKDLRGWFARDAAGAWYFDSDAGGAVNPGDLALTGAAPGTKVRPGSADIGTALTGVQGTLPPGQRIGWVDADRDSRRDGGEAIYVDLDANRAVSRGDLRVTPGGLGLDNNPTRAEYEALAAQAGSQASQLQAQAQQLQAQLRELDASKQREAATAMQAEARAQGLAGMLQMLLVLTLLAFAGLVVVAWYARNLYRQVHAPADRGSGEGRA